MKKNMKIPNKLKLKNNAFTLVEIIAVITVLALLLLIIVPKVNDVMEDSRQEINKKNAESLIKLTDAYYSQYMANDDKNMVFNSDENLINHLDIDGEKPESGFVMVKPTGEISMGVVFDKVCYVKNYNTDEITIAEDIEECKYIGLVPAIKPDAELPAAICGNTLTPGSASDSMINAIVYDKDLTRNNNCAGTVDYRFHYVSDGKGHATIEPKNYITFNNERWRMLGLVNGYVKIFREVYSSDKRKWDNEHVNDWTKSSLQEYLNGEFYNDMTNEAKNMIQPATYNLGGVYGASYSDEEMWEIVMIEPDENVYNYENGLKVPEGNPTQIKDTKITLMYPSDYLYSFPGGCDEEFEMYHCMWSNTWLRFNGYQQWLMSPSISQGKATRIETQYGFWGIDPFRYENSPDLKQEYNYTPALYLKPSVEITGGEGTVSNPYTLGMN